ncbi:hypothetical protein PsorP6_003135 [Peronosclerospora sorghi]|uniref:Uncharacterized protein n=1 Tax=Peronosclerospora sorghi TaxID=230839 RepID=A0ACC0VPP7_9STRA|nr:hypothetical protein PsorP6_003135 [Peronosclerospora sorghi]
MPAADVSARLYVVAEKLQQKAQDAQRKGQDSAARGLLASVSDVRDALALLAEQRHLLARRHGEGEEPDHEAANAHVHELAGRLARVSVMLGKKAEDMKTKGNEQAAVALQQSAVAVDKGRVELLAQQETIFGLLERWEQVESVVFGEKGTPRTSREDTRGHEQEPSAPNQLVARVQYLVNLHDVVAAVLSGCKDVQEVEEELKKWQQVEKETQELRCELEHARKEAEEVKRTLQDERAALETMRIEMKRVKKREATRQEEDAVLLEQQREACQAMEQLVRESDQEIQRMVDSAARQADELESLRREMESLNADKERLVRLHREEVEDLQGQLTRAMDTLSTKTTEHEDAQTQEIQTLQTQLASMKVEKETLVKETMDELKKLQCQLDQALMCGKSKKGGKKSAKKLHLLQTKIDALGKEKESLVKLHSTEVEALEKAHARAIEELQEKLTSRTAATSTDGNEYKKESTTNEVQRRGEANEDTQDTDTSEAEERVRVATLVDTIPSHVAGSDEPLQDQNDMMASMEKKQDELGIELEKRKRNKLPTVEELQRAHAAEISRMQAELAILQSLVDKTDTRYQAQKSVIATMETERAELQEQVELLTREKTQTMGERGSLETQLEETRALLAAKSAELKEATEMLARCEEDLTACRAQVDAQVSECKEFKRELETADIRDMDKQRLSTLVAELQDVMSLFKSSQESTMQDLTAKVWQSQEVSELSSAWARLVTELVAALKQLDTIEEQLKVAQRAHEADKRMLDEFIRTTDWHLFVKDGEERDEPLAVDKEFHEYLAMATENVSCWLAERQVLRDLVEQDAIKIHALEHETQQEQERRVAKLRAEKAESEKAAERFEAKCVQARHDLVAQQTETSQVAQELATVLENYERYRRRSHTALKNVEKRAELLNGMRKENEELRTRVQASERARDEALAACQARDVRLQEAIGLQQMIQSEFEQVATENMRRMTELELEVETGRMEKERLEARIQDLMVAVQELEREKENWTNAEAKRMEDAEQAAVHARLETTTIAAQLQQVADALNASQAENEKLQQQIESLQATQGTDTASGDVSCVPEASVASSAEEVRALQAIESSLRSELEDVRAALSALQERFATTKAANADKVFALEEQLTHWKNEVAAVTAAMQRRIDALETEKEQVETEWSHARTENALLMKTLEHCRGELDDTRRELHQVLERDTDSGDDESRRVSKTTELLAARDEALKKLRLRVLELEEANETLEREKTALAQQVETTEVSALHASRHVAHSDKLRASRRQHWQHVLATFQTQLEQTVTELHERLEDHARAFRAVCDFRDRHGATVRGQDDPSRATTVPAFQECLVMRSGVVIKAGTRFELPVVCEASGWRVVWSFSIEEENADVVFRLSALTHVDDVVTDTELVAPERMHDMSGVLPVRHARTTLVFQWDNSFSWLNEKTLDYHVSIQEPLTREAQVVRQSEMEVQRKATVLEEGRALLQVEAQSRADLNATLARLEACEALKENHVAECWSQKRHVGQEKTRVQHAMETQKALMAATLAEQEEVEDVERRLVEAWEAAQAERQDADMTLQLVGAQLETLTREIEAETISISTERRADAPETSLGTQ